MILSFFRKKQDPCTQKTNAHSISYTAFASTDVGAVRENNEDKVLFIKPSDREIINNKGVLGIVADGMGGHNHGEIAAQMAVNIISQEYYSSNHRPDQALKFAFDLANKIIYHKACETEALRGMGTTCTAIVIVANDVYLAHAGDSRAYMITKDNSEKLSTDHTYVQHLLDHDIIKEDQVLNHPEKNVITKSLGTNIDITPEVKIFPNLLSEEDLILLCSDGLYEYVLEDEMRNLLNTYPISTAGDEMISLANARGGHDNISVLIMAKESPGKRRTSNKVSQVK